MSWEAIAALGQAVSALALVSVLIQVRQARDEARRTASQYRLDSAHDMTSVFLNNERLGAIVCKAHTALGLPDAPFVGEMMRTAGLTREEAQTYEVYCTSWWLFRAKVIARMADLPPSERVEFNHSTRGQYAPGSIARLWYERNKDWLPNRDAVRYVDDLLAQST